MWRIEIKCAVCGFEIETVDEAIENGWNPYFYDGQVGHEFACPGCAQVILRVDETGEMEMKEEFRGKMKYLDDGPEESRKDHPLMGIAVLEGEHGKLN